MRCLEYKFLVISLSCLLAVQSVSAHVNADTLDMKALRKDMYLHYSKRHTPEFLATIGKIKALAAKQGDEKELYKAYGNEIIYTSSYINKGKSIEMAKDLIHLAEQNHSKYGLYTAYYALGTIYSSLGHFPEASDYYQDALSILEKYYPGESRSALHLATAKVERSLHHDEQVKHEVEAVLADPKANMQHKLSAMSYKYLTYMDGDSSKVLRDQLYVEREKLKRQYGHDDNFGYIVDFDQAVLRGDYKLARQIVDSIPNASKLTKAQYYSNLYLSQGDYKTALEYYKKYKRLSDSINNDRVRNRSLDVGMLLDKARAENEAKDLRLTNQELEMARIASELEKKRMAEEALALSMDMHKSRVEEMEAQRESDSLMAYNKELQLSEYRSQMEAFENAERTRRMKWIAFWVLGGMGFLFVGIYANSRRLQLRRLREAYDKLEETTAAKERIDSELRIAREIQMAMVPHEFPASKRLDIYASMTPAKEVGGDLYDFVAYDDKLYFCVGDVSGKGVPAALFMAMSARLFRTLSKYRLQPAEIANAMNNELVQNNENGMFVTMFIGLLDLNSGQLDFCNAGHNPPILDGEFMEIESNAPLGLWEGLDYVGERKDSIRGQVLFVYSDGLNEAENSRHDQFGDDRLLAFIRDHKEVHPRTLIDLLQQDVESHVNGADPSDDLTMLCLRKK